MNQQLVKRTRPQPGQRLSSGLWKTLQVRQTLHLDLPPQYYIQIQHLLVSFEQEMRHRLHCKTHLAIIFIRQLEDFQWVM